jgi:pimeloyl-ACP methyl ester carboxylesterase
MIEREVALASGVVAVLEGGAGGKPLMLVHGFTGAKEDFGWNAGGVEFAYVDRLASQGWHVVAPDLWGHGRSTHLGDESAYSLDVFVDQVLDLADHLGWKRFTLLGHSMGGMIAQVLALRDPSRVEALTLMDTCAGVVPGTVPEVVELGQAVAREGGMAVIAAVSAEAGIGANEADQRMRAERPDYAAFCDAKTLSSDAAMFAAMLGRLAAEEDRASDLRALLIPTQVICGSLDEWMLGESKRLADAIPGARFDVIEGGGHCPQFESPELWWEAFNAFLGNVPA